ncbi:MAG: metallophosphoesterase [Fermentimonas sp.]|nr:metallophosphoesterase [Fermentimonas sp.]
MKKQIISAFIFLLILNVSLGSISAFSQTISSKEENSIRMMSYNIRNAKGLDNVTDYDRIANVILWAAPDIIGIQELDSVTGRSNGVDVLDLLSRKTLMYSTYAASIDYNGGKYGIGILSKEKPINVLKVPLPCNDEPRMLLIVELEDYYFGNTHFSLNAEDRMKAVDIIKSEVKKLDPNKPFFFVGDINDIPESDIVKSLMSEFVSLVPNNQYTSPADNPIKCIDYIFGYNGVESWSLLTDKGVINEKVASDHRPLFADIRIHSDKESVFRTKPYLQNPTGNGITISWLTNVPVHSWVEYGVDGNLDQKMELYVDGQMIVNNFHHKYRLENLIPGETYNYRVCSREIAVYEAYRKEFGEIAISDIYTFRLPKENETDFSAIVFNDLHQRRNLIDLFSDLIADNNYDFVVFNGDNIDDPRNEKQAVASLSYMNEKVRAESVPVFYVRGNHEIRNAYSIGLRDLLDYVGDKTYGSFNWGDTRFVILDCGEDKIDDTPVYYGFNDFSGLRKDQAHFLNKEINSSEFKQATKRILIHHIPVYGLGENAYNPSLDEWGYILKNADFNVSLHGHTHRFEYHPKGSVDNNFPVVIGGGNSVESATVTILEKEGNKMSLRVLNANGVELLKKSL